MRSEEFISILSNISAEDHERFLALRQDIPLGVDELGETVTAFPQVRRGIAHQICVTGTNRGEFIRRLVVTLASIYGKGELCFLIVSPDVSYGELLSLNGADVTVPYIRTGKDIEQALDTLGELMLMRRSVHKKFPRLIVVLDGLETVMENRGGLLEEYQPFTELARGTDVEIITGVDLLKSIYKGYPGAFVGIGNCLVTADGEGKTDVTYAKGDSSLTAPIALDYPSSPTVKEMIAFFNALPQE
ncbi:MAG: hypothetical protein IJB97_01685 [Clostridia bacterium]|nr:hypothetical protein [Clostridia bacterium]